MDVQTLMHALTVPAVCLVCLAAWLFALDERRRRLMTLRNLLNERAKFRAYRQLHAPPKNWSDTRSVTIVYEPGVGVRPVQGKDMRRT